MNRSITNTIIFCARYCIFGFFAACLFSLYCQVYDYDAALVQCDGGELTPPKPEADGRTQTLNRKGAVTAKYDYATVEFLKYAKGKEVLEIGGAYGNVMLDAIKQNMKTKYTLNDLDKRHLFIAAKKMSQKIQKGKLGEGSKDQVKFLEADITNADQIKDIGQYDAILVARVLHFLTPEQLDTTIKHLFLLLKPGGRVFVVAITPYVKRYENFIPVYEERLKNGDQNPGFVHSLYDYVNTDKEVTSPEQLKVISPEPFYFLDDKVLKEKFESKGYKIVECRMTPLSYKSPSWSLNGKENVILIAEKSRYTNLSMTLDGKDNVIYL